MEIEGRRKEKLHIGWGFGMDMGSVEKE